MAATNKIEVLGYKRTLIGDYIQSINWSQLPYVMDEFTTLNEVFNVQSGVAPDANLRPVMKYLVIGNKGNTYVIGPDNAYFPRDKEYGATQIQCYGHIPFIAREVKNDLAQADRKRYGLRTEKTINGVKYVFYWARRIDMSSVTTSKRISTVNGTRPGGDEYKYTARNMEPKEISYNTDGTAIASKSTVFTSTPVTIELTAEDIAEIVSAYRLYNNSELTPTLSELGFCTGVDKEVAIPGTDQYYTEVLACQVNVFINTENSLRSANGGLTFDINLGSAEPLVTNEEQ